MVVDRGLRVRRNVVKVKILDEGADLVMRDVIVRDAMTRGQEDIEARMKIEVGEDGRETGGTEIGARVGGEEIAVIAVAGEGTEIDVIEEIGMKAVEGEEVMTKAGEEDGADLEATGAEEIEETEDGDISQFQKQIGLF